MIVQLKIEGKSCSESSENNYIPSMSAALTVSKIKTQDI